MIKHLVLLKLNDLSDLEELKKGFEGLQNQIPEIKRLTIMDNAYTKREANQDVMFELEFDNINDLETYLEHDKHVEFVTNVIKVKAVPTVFDYEL